MLFLCLNLDWAGKIVKAITEAYDTVTGEAKDLYKGAINVASGIESLVNDLGSDVAVSR